MVRSESTSRRPALGCLFELVETLVLTLVIFLGVQTFIAQPFKVEGGSMEATLQPDSYLLIDKLTPRWAPFRRGDVVVFVPPTTSDDPTGVPFIKRVIAVPGDYVQLKDGQVFVNATAIAEPYVFTDGGPIVTNPAPGGASEWRVLQGQLFVLGDHRDRSSDSRFFGPIEMARVIGRAWLRYWPIEQLGTLPAPSYPTLSQNP